MVDYREIETSTSIKSYGLIVFVRDQDDQHPSDPQLKFLLIQKRETYEYMTFMKGIWRTIADLTYLLSKMTTDERSRIRNYTFDELWDDLWVSDKYSFYTSGYSHSKRKYFEARPHLADILDNTTTDAHHLPWEFPKGKKSSTGESYVECALREFYEETGIHTKGVRLCKNCVPIGEMYVGGDNKKYSTLYYVAEAPSALTPAKFDTKRCIRKRTVSSEAIDARWMTVEELTPLVSRTRRMVIRKICRLVKSGEI